MTRLCLAPHLGGVEAWHDCQHDLMWFTRADARLRRAVASRASKGMFTVVVLGAGPLGRLLLLRQGLAEEL